MSTEPVYVIRNQLAQYWARSREWVDGREPQRLMKFRHRDEALNQLVELSARDIELRGEVFACELDERGHPAVAVSAHATPTLSEKAAQEAANAEPTEESQPGAEVSTADESSAPNNSASA